MKIILSYLLISVFFINLLFAENNRKHPRVIQVEKVLFKDASQIMNDLIPNKPFAIFIEIDPIHRNTQNNNNKDALPFYEPDDEIKDEWDDPDKSDYALLSRVNRVNVKVLIPPELTEEQVDEIKQGLFLSLHLITGRDTIEVQRKSWMAEKDATSYTRWLIFIGLIFVGMFGLIILIISFLSLNRVVKAINNIKIDFPEGSSGSGGGGGLSMSMSSPSSSSGSKDHSSGNDGMRDLRLNDPIKMMEIIKSLIQTLVQSKSFPDLHDMIILDKFCKEDSQSLGALLAEFPEDLRTKVFALSSHSLWLEALSNPGEITPRCIEVMNRLVKNLRQEEKSIWNHFLILCWRLNTNELTDFLKSLSWDYSMAILVDLPCSLSLPIAREVVPGNWGVLLKSDFRPSPIPQDKVDQYKQKLLSMKPLKTFKKIEDYKREVDLLDFLKIVDPVIEKEIYGASVENSLIRQSRPPFYKVLEGTDLELKNVVQNVSMEDWALALFNLTKKQRTLIDIHFSDRQKIRLIEYFKTFDRLSVDLFRVGEAREKVAKIFKEQNDIFKEKKIENDEVFNQDQKAS